MQVIGKLPAIPGAGVMASLPPGLAVPGKAFAGGWLNARGHIGANVTSWRLKSRFIQWHVDAAHFSNAPIFDYRQILPPLTHLVHQSTGHNMSRNPCQIVEPHQSMNICASIARSRDFPDPA